MTAMRDIAVKMKDRRREDSMEDKFGWYYRHWKSGGVSKEAKT